MNSHVRRIIKIQDKAIRIINFADFRAPTSELYKKSRILKFRDNVILSNYLYVHNTFTRRIPTILQNKFTYLHTNHNHLTRNSKLQCVKLPISRTIEYGIHSINGQSARNWNTLQINLFKESSTNITRNRCKTKLKAYFLDSY